MLCPVPCPLPLSPVFCPLPGVPYVLPTCYHTCYHKRYKLQSSFFKEIMVASSNTSNSGLKLIALMVTRWYYVGNM